MSKEICANWMNPEAARQTIQEYDEKWGGSDIEYDLGDFNIQWNCMSCDKRPELPPPLEAFNKAMDIFKDPILKKLEEVGMTRKCFKPVSEKGDEDEKVIDLSDMG